MCGLIAAWDPSRRWDVSLDTALGDLRHRGPDAQAGIWLDHRKLWLGHARLKIIDTSDSANQPVTSPCGRYTLVFNGEIVNYPEVRAKLDNFWTWRTHSDTEVLLAAWARWGSDCLHELVGMFAFVVHDAKLNRVTIVRDRFGIKPLYYYAHSDKWAFASEIPPLLRLSGKARANEATIRTYLESGYYSHSCDTFFSDIYAVEPGTLIDVDLANNQWTQRRWYDLIEHVSDLGAATDAEIESAAGRHIDEAIRSHLIADVDVGLNVSGGVDSSMLVTVALDNIAGVHLFTQDYDGYSELPWVREVAASGVLHVANLTPEIIERWLPITVRSQGEPFGGIFVCGYNALYQMAVDNGITVLLDGNGVDEIFLGYMRYHQIYVYSAPDDMERARRASDYTAFWGSPPRPTAGTAIDGTSGLFPQAMSRHLQCVDPLPLPTVPELEDPVRRAALQDLLYAKIPRGLRFNDRVSMAHSRELRVPYLDHRLVEFAFGIPTDKLLNRRGTKAVFRDLLARKGAASVAYAPKRSVQSPQREWLAHDWWPLVESVLASDSFLQRGWVDPAAAKIAYSDYLAGTQDNSFFIWQWINLELWAREYLDKGVSH